MICILTNILKDAIQVELKQFFQALALTLTKNDPPILKRNDPPISS
jgi:hypothetical protein